MFSGLSFLACYPLVANALGLPQWGGWHHHPSPSFPSSSWHLQKFTSLVVFGDSYSDDSRLGFFIANKGQAPPVGWDDPVNLHSADGGRIWGQYVKQYAGVNLYNYAVSGAVCSNAITPRFFSLIDAPFPAVKEYEVPAYIADSHFVEKDGRKFMVDPPGETVYAIWIGTNDLGADALIQDEQVVGTNITTYVDCVYGQLDRVYANGGRFFVLMNVAPLYLAPEYAAPPHDVGVNQYWADKPHNHTRVNGRMAEQVETVNMIYEFRTPVAVQLQRRYPGASFALYDVSSLMVDIFNHPSEYLNGTAPLDVTGFVNRCNATGGNCVANPSPDSFMWFDELHPSEQTERVIAREFVQLVEKGSSRWATYFSS